MAQMAPDLNDGPKIVSCSTEQQICEDIINSENGAKYKYLAYDGSPGFIAPFSDDRFGQNFSLYANVDVSQIGSLGAGQGNLGTLYMTKLPARNAIGVVPNSPAGGMLSYCDAQGTSQWDGSLIPLETRAPTITAFDRTLITCAEFDLFEASRYGLQTTGHGCPYTKKSVGVIGTREPMSPSTPPQPGCDRNGHGVTMNIRPTRANAGNPIGFSTFQNVLKPDDANFKQCGFKKENPNYELEWDPEWGAPTNCMFGPHDTCPINTQYAFDIEWHFTQRLEGGYPHGHAPTSSNSNSAPALTWEEGGDYCPSSSICIQVSQQSQESIDGSAQHTQKMRQRIDLGATANKYIADDLISDMTNWSLISSYWSGGTTWADYCDLRNNPKEFWEDLQSMCNPRKPPTTKPPSSESDNFFCLQTRCCGEKTCPSTMPFMHEIKNCNEDITCLQTLYGKTILENVDTSLGCGAHQGDGWKFQVYSDFAGREDAGCDLKTGVCSASAYQSATQMTAKEQCGYDNGIYCTVPSTSAPSLPQGKAPQRGMGTMGGSPGAPHDANVDLDSCPSSTTHINDMPNQLRDCWCRGNHTPSAPYFPPQLAADGENEQNFLKQIRFGSFAIEPQGS